MKTKLPWFGLGLWMIIGGLLQVRAQDAIYLTNGNSFPFRLVEATEELVKYSEVKGGRELKRSFQRENVLMALNASGGILLISELDTNPGRANQQITDFYTQSKNRYDVLVKAEPLQAIVATISYSSDEVINYKTAQGVSGSINKSELALLLHSDGRHEFMFSMEDLAPYMPDMVAVINRAKQEASQVAQKAPAVPKSSPKSTAAVPKSASATRSKPSLSEEELSGYREKSLRRVDEFVQYLNIITDKALEAEEKDKAIDQAAKLFLTNATIQVTSVNNPGIKTYPIREYLTRLKLLPYSSTNIEWHEVNYVSELAQAEDGHYYGLISGTQTFTGYGANGDDILYSDVTQKNVKVKLQSYQKTVEGQQQLNWEVLLGNIGVAVAR